MTIADPVIRVSFWPTGKDSWSHQLRPLVGIIARLRLSVCASSQSQGADMAISTRMTCFTISSHGTIAREHPPGSDMRLGSGSAALARGVVGGAPVLYRDGLPMALTRGSRQHGKMSAMEGRPDGRRTRPKPPFLPEADMDLARDQTPPRYFLRTMIG
jgi:hypothetical protein